LEATTTLFEHLEDEFGANSSYVRSMLERYLSSPSLIDESWRGFFSELLANYPLDEATVLELAKSNESQTEGERPTLSANGSENGSGQVKNGKANAAPSKKKSAIFEGAEPLAGASKKIVENMEQSLAVPTATSIRLIPVKLLEENRRLINQFLSETGGGKASFTHLIAWALVRALEVVPQMNDAFVLSNDVPSRLKRREVNLGIAIDLARKDGSRSLLVPNIKSVGTLNFSQFLSAYNDKIKRARAGKLEMPDFDGTTVTLTNPGTIGTVGSVPRLMSGQSLILATGAIEYPAEYQAMSPEVLSQLGIGKVVQISSTYDHRVIQGAESGQLLQRMHELLLGNFNFYGSIFVDLGVPTKPYTWSIDTNPALLGGDRSREQMVKQARVLELINSYRVRGHLIANIDPLHAMPLHYHPELEMESYGLTIWDLDRNFITGGLGGKESMTLREILDLLHRAYCGTVGTEYRHIQDKEQKLWLRKRLEGEPQVVPVEVRKAILWKLISAEQFEQFLHKNFLGQKRFSVEGCEVVIALLDQLIEGAAERGVDEIVLGMAHRGRINVLANVLGHFCERIFTSFIGSVHPSFPADEGDVKYHQGAKAMREVHGRELKLTLSPNPSHLEFVDAVVEGMTRAKQDHRAPGSTTIQKVTPEREKAWGEVLPLLLHGDAAFAGQGIVMETLNLADLKGYRTGGTIHVIVNNQIGFTTSPSAGRSTIYSTDVAKMTQLPIFHINGDDPDAVWRVLQIALDFRQKFHKDVVLDVVGFRRLGHNEADEPSYTQPLMYQRVKAHPGVRTIYAHWLVKDGVMTEEEVEGLMTERNRLYSDALARAKEIVAHNVPMQTLPSPQIEEDGSAVVDTAVTAEMLAKITEQISIVPENFHLNPKMVSQLARRAKMGAGTQPMDWAFGEAMAFGSLSLQGTRVRLSGQDSGRGTFSQRHAVLYDIESGKAWTPLANMPNDSGGVFEVYDSSLSEQGVLGFEYGYSVIAKKALTLWEAQFGDFANGAQVIVDQFIASGEDKWQQRTRLALLLPHGYEGQGPEHSSARLERFLELCGENNMQVAYPTTPAQYFHLLRRQIVQETARPLIVMTPKSLLRLPAATSQVSELLNGGFQPVIDDASIKEANAIKKIVVTTGKVYYDIVEGRKTAGSNDVALVRVEQYYPFPSNKIAELIERYPNATSICWAQEEPENIGAWEFVRPRLESIVPERLGKLRFVGRNRSASPATGFYTIHQLEQQEIVRQSLL
jgi:2-oxoglutarate decarboxylase